jgi:hypothetical protein
MLGLLVYALNQVRQGVDAQRWDRVIEWVLYAGLAYHVVAYLTGYSLQKIPLKYPSSLSFHPPHMIDDVDKAIAQAAEDEVAEMVEAEEMSVNGNGVRTNTIDLPNGDVVEVPVNRK